MHVPSLLSRSVRIVPMFVSGFCVHPNVLGPWSIIVKWSRKYDQYLAFRAPPSFLCGLASSSPEVTRAALALAVPSP